MITAPLIRVTFLLAEHRPPFRTLWEGDLPAVPDAGEPFAFGGRIYRVLERSWRMGTEKRKAQTLEPVEDDVTVVACGVLLQQEGGPAHVLVSAAPPAQQ